MSPWYITFDSTFWITITTIVAGIISLSVRTCLRSKCDSFECCCLKVHRNTEQEDTQEHLASSSIELQNQGTPQNRQPLFNQV